MKAVMAAVMVAAAGAVEFYDVPEARAQGEAACNGGPPGTIDCGFVDMGSCGTACCKLDFHFEAGMTPLKLKNALMAVLGNGGPDGRFALTTAAFGTFGFSIDYNTIEPMPYHYVGQAYHTTPMPDGKNVTSGPYRDTVNFMISTDASRGGATNLRAFSLSDINGALGDNGMNYKAIMLTARALMAAGHKLQMSRPDQSCPAPKK